MFTGSENHVGEGSSKCKGQFSKGMIKERTSADLQKIM